MRLLCSLLLVCLSGPALAAGPDQSPRPIARGDFQVATPASASPQRPRARPDRLTEQLVQDLARQRFGAPSAPTSDDLAANTPGVVTAALDVRSLRPTTRPQSIVQKAMARKREAQRGQLGGISGVQGEEVGRVPGPGGCGINRALKVTHVAGVRLSTPALMDVNTAKALKRWVETGMKPAVGSMGGGVEKIRVVAHYACRTRNNQPGARLSEHGKGRAIDIAGFTLRNGETLSVLNHWGGGAKGRALRRMHREACGPFGTVLGPDANRFHRDHFHFDTARYRSGSYCK